MTMSIFDKMGSRPGGVFGTPGEEADDDEFPGDTEEEGAARALGELESAFMQRAKREGDRFELATDSEYWVAVCFQSRGQKEQFLAGLARIAKRAGVEVDGDKYIDGWDVAKALGIALDRVEVPYNTSSKVDSVWRSLTRK